ncbi:Basal-body rod modification protein FlgD [bacterium HR21]|jgi:flagellar basal-body rod modification protein FlgD|nr:Basal-body rod modification protein FlgD [bacterium HR21]
MAEAVGAVTGAQGTLLIPNGAGSGKEDFLRLLIAQLRMQSPLKPYEGQELAVQLAIFSQLEQLLSVRQLLELQVSQLSGLAETVGNAATPALVGAYVRAESSLLRLSPDATEVRFGYELPEEAQSVRVEICTSSGAVVRSWEFRNVPPGDHRILWDGRAASGERLPAGTYTVRITAVGTAGQQLEVRPFLEGVVEAVRFTAQGAMMLIGELEVPLSGLLEIRKRP